MVLKNDRESSSGKGGFTDLLLHLTDNPSKLFWVGLFLLMVLGMSFAFVASIKWLFSIGGAEVRISNEEGPQVFFETASGKKTYLVVVHPQGWQKTSIQLRKGDQVTCRAEGRVNIDLYGLTDKLSKRHRLETITAKKYHIDENSSDVPEKHYTASDWNAIRLTRPWMGPQGIAGFVSSFGGRRKLRLIPNAPYGMLIGAIKAGNSDLQPSAVDAFAIGASSSFTAQSDGELWMNINDIVNDKEPDVFYVDNIGFYSVSITVTPVTKGWFGK